MATIREYLESNVTVKSVVILLVVLALLAAIIMPSTMVEPNDKNMLSKTTQFSPIKIILGSEKVAEIEANEVYADKLRALLDLKTKENQIEKLDALIAEKYAKKQAYKPVPDNPVKVDNDGILPAGTIEQQTGKNQ